MNLRTQAVLRRMMLALPALMVAAWFVPRFFSAERFRQRVAAGLQHGLRRPVTFGRVEFRLLWQPGFSIENAVVHEDPAFGSEPFARVDRIDCGLRWRSLLFSHIDCATLSLDHPTFNLVRNARGDWNTESLLNRRIASLTGSPVHRHWMIGAPDVDVSADEGRISFKIGNNKKPFAITELKGHIRFESARGLIAFAIEGRPVRTDVSVAAPGGLPPSPGIVRFNGEWHPGTGLRGPLRATLRSTKSLLYDWIPVLTGRNREIYGIVDATANISGSVQDMQVEGDCEIRQLHRWELPPPSSSIPLRIQYRGDFNRGVGRLQLEHLTGSFGDSSVHIAGVVDNIPVAPRLDLILALDNSHVEDLIAMGGRFWGASASFGLTGRISGLLAVRGPYAAPRYGGMLSTHDVSLETPHATFPVGEAKLQIDFGGIQFSPTRIAWAPGVETTLQGILHFPGQLNRGNSPRQGEASSRTSRSTPAAVVAAGQTGQEEPWRYEVSLSGNGIPLRGLLRIAPRRVNAALHGVEVDAGTTSGDLQLTGVLFTRFRPLVEGQLQIAGVQLSVPGFAEPVEIENARIRLNNNQIVADPVNASVAGTSFTGTVVYDSDSRHHWRFTAQTGVLNLEQASQWFESLNPGRISLLDLFPALRSLDPRRRAAVELLRTINAAGALSAAAVTYRDLKLADFDAAVTISESRVRLSKVSFRSGGGRGQGNLGVDLSVNPARVSGTVSLNQASIQAIADRLPSALKGMRAQISGSAQFETLGLKRESISSNLHAVATLKLRDVSFGQFDPLQTLVREAGFGSLEPTRGEVSVRNVAWTVEVRDRRVFLVQAPLELSGAKLQLTGNYAFDGTADLGIHCDFGRLKRRWQTAEGLNTAMPEPDSAALAVPHAMTAGLSNYGIVSDLRVHGPVQKLTVVPALEISHSTR